MRGVGDRKSTRLNSSHTEIYTLSLHDALPIWYGATSTKPPRCTANPSTSSMSAVTISTPRSHARSGRSEEHTSELQSHRDLHSFPTRRSSDLVRGDFDEAATLHRQSVDFFDECGDHFNAALACAEW